MILETPHGRIALVAVDDALAAELHPDERALAARLAPVRARELIAGRAALRRAGAGAGPILPDPRGAPILPPHLSGSVSHKGARAAAIVAPLAHGRVGVDLERTRGLRADIARRILTANELAALPADEAARERAVLRAFSIKEAIYKAIDPFPMVQRYVGFQEVELGAGDVVISALPLAIEVTVREVDDHWLSTARATLRP